MGPQTNAIGVNRYKQTQALRKLKRHCRLLGEQLHWVFRHTLGVNSITKLSLKRPLFRLCTARPL